ncbi:glutaminyl-peptide cyclotransferase [Rugamonas sp. CCM 8940]|uniref:glutaminyl-peptide cyclotransferase n=1 Tax=Rugamonas sp. CCM 8940 TaxID=2765359 RepID=UPI0018F5B5BD|nr:glutaminyl-peptide cyclotransferase [Rugamonas sp. CCM 8940]MBJ7313810.1 glutaminyl-peptide cyclotransferase [Rugamonas sp. CCM 8940]
MRAPSPRAAGAFLLKLLSLLTLAHVAGAASRAPSLTSASAVPVYRYEVLHAYPHDANAFTQGLFYDQGVLYESTGLQGRSSVRKVRLETGEVLQQTNLSPAVFGEGITQWDKRLIGVTWQSELGYVLDQNSFAVQQLFDYKGEGWGLTQDGRAIIMSDGSAELRFLDPLTLKEQRRLRVTADGQPVDQLNELEWVEGEIYANIWQTDRIARIDPASGKVVGWIDLAGLLGAKERAGASPDVLNGIAYDSVGKRLFVTGKLWPRLYEIRLLAPAKPAQR